MAFRILGALAVAYGLANILLFNLLSVDLGTFLSFGNKDYTGAAAIILGGALFSLGERMSEKKLDAE